MAFILNAMLVVLVLVVSIAVDLFLRLLDWSLTPSGQARRVDGMSNIDTVNNELFVAFGHREGAGDPDEADTTPYTSEAERKALVASAMAYADTELDVHVEYETGDEFV